ncbi:hypothetical protein BFX40_10790 [Mesorhizobium sp. SEMIA 3007]|nr:hypothetical protein BFX40_10790 [Mesorhizobium sp. SEMIA 3007]
MTGTCPAIETGTATKIRINRDKISDLIARDPISDRDNAAAVLVTETDWIAFVAVAQIERSICPADPTEFDLDSYEISGEVLAQCIARQDKTTR